MRASLPWTSEIRFKLANDNSRGNVACMNLLADTLSSEIKYSNQMHSYFSGSVGMTVNTKKTISSHVIALFLILAVNLALSISAHAEQTCPQGTGPGGIKAGSYPPTSLTQEQRQWLFSAFGHAGIAPDGYGGESCGNTQPTQQSAQPMQQPAQPAQQQAKPAWFGQGCGTSSTGPGGLRAGGYSPQDLTQQQRQWLFEVFGNSGSAPDGYGGQTCSWQNQPAQQQAKPAWFGQGCGTSSTGPGGLRAGGYSPQELTQQQRQWLFEVFGNSGIAPDGYGGQTCGWQNQPAQQQAKPAWFGQGCGTSFTGPGDLKVGGYSPQELTQQQRQWLFEVFGNSGIAPDGYGGQTCIGSTADTPTEQSLPSSNVPNQTGSASVPPSNGPEQTGSASVPSSNGPEQTGSASTETWSISVDQCEVNPQLYDFYKDPSNQLNLVTPMSFAGPQSILIFDSKWACFGWPRYRCQPSDV